MSDAFPNIEDMIEKAQAQTDQGRTFALDAFSAMAEVGKTPSVEQDGQFFVNVEILKMLAQACAVSAMTLHFKPGGDQAAASVGRIAVFIDALVKESNGSPLTDIRERARQAGLID